MPLQELRITSCNCNTAVSMLSIDRNTIVTVLFSKMKSSQCHTMQSQKKINKQSMSHELAKCFQSTIANIAVKAKSMKQTEVGVSADPKVTKTIHVVVLPSD